MRLIGLTGGIATGKTTAAKYFSAKYNVAILNVDDISRLVTDKGSEVLSEIVKHFGKEVLNNDGSLNRAYILRIIISDKSLADVLEGIVVPSISRFVSARLQELDESGQEVVFVENAIMFERGTSKNYDEIIVVTCSEAQQLDRLIGRDNTEKHSRRMIARQWPLKDKEALATYLIKNDGDINSLEREIGRVWKEIKGKNNGSC